MSGRKPRQTRLRVLVVDQYFATHVNANVSYAAAHSIGPDQVLDRQGAAWDADYATAFIQRPQVDPEEAKLVDQSRDVGLCGRVRTREEQHAPAPKCARVFAQQLGGQVVKGLHHSRARHALCKDFGRQSSVKIGQLERGRDDRVVCVDDDTSAEIG